MSEILHQVIADLNEWEEKRHNHNQHILITNPLYQKAPMYDEEFLTKTLTRLVDEINRVEEHIEMMEKTHHQVLNNFYENGVPEVVQQYQKWLNLLVQLKVQVIALYPDLRWSE